MNFIRAVNDYAVSRQRVHPYYSDTMARKRLNYHPELMEMGEWLEELEGTVRRWQENIDCRIDPQEQCKVSYSVGKYLTVVENAIEKLNNTFP